MQILDLLARIEDEAPFDILDGRFAYWRGFSGQRYLHTVYDPDELDGLAGGVAILVGSGDAVLHVLHVGAGASGFARCEGAVSAHVHFPRSEADAASACNDLRAALVGRIKAL